MRVGLITLGCDKNTVDAEYLAGLLEDLGCELVALTEDSPRWSPGVDAVVVTTCGFVADAKRQSVEAVVELAESKRKTGIPRRIYVAGCLSQRYVDTLLREIPEIDGVVGVGQFEELAGMIVRGAGGAVNRVRAVPKVDICRLMRRRRLDQRPYAFLKIADGCDHACTFCSIPSMKGDLRSAPREILLNEARSLLDQGVRELNLVAQDISVYGADRWRAYRLPDLLRDLCSLNGDFWVRCLYCYPGGVTDALIEALAGDPKIVPYLDIPLQHLDPEMLRRMKRPSHTINTVKLVERLRKAIPNLTLRTTVMVGFPGETPQAFRRLLDGLRALAFDRLGVFQYSREEGTPAAAMRRQVGKAVKEKRWHAVMELQAQISARLNRRRIGTRTRVLIEGYEAQRRRWVGRSSAEAPEVDGNVLVAGAKPLCPGQLVTVEITETETYDLMGRVITTE